MQDSLRGHFLISGVRLRDPNFFKTAVLIIEHNQDGAMGLVINRPSSMTVANVLAGHFDLPQTDDVAYLGGPVEQTALFIIHDVCGLSDEQEPVVPGVFVGNDSRIFEEVMNSAYGSGSAMRYRVYCGCAGWAPGQLEGELARGDWFVRPASAKYLFHENPYTVWECLLHEVHESHRLLPHTCKHPEWN